MRVDFKEVNYGILHHADGKSEVYCDESKWFNCVKEGMTEHFCWWYIEKQLPKEFDSSINYIYIDIILKRVEIDISVNKDEFIRLVYAIV